MIILKEYKRCRDYKQRGDIAIDYGLKLEDSGWNNSLLEGGVISPDGSTIFYYARSPYNGQVHMFNRDKESYEKNIKRLLTTGDFLPYNNR